MQGTVQSVLNMRAEVYM